MIPCLHLTISDSSVWLDDSITLAQWPAVTDSIKVFGLTRAYFLFPGLELQQGHFHLPLGHKYRTLVVLLVLFMGTHPPN
uniref:Uncharacterized protein n=1 Tax=Anguilla anguilla TaxID=7936 RepID=A0A0E9PU76_ANGAN